MKNVNYTDAEYRILCSVADYYNTKPAELVHEWSMHRAKMEWAAILKAREGMESGDVGDVDESRSHVPIPSHDREAS